MISIYPVFMCPNTIYIICILHHHLFKCLTSSLDTDTGTEMTTNHIIGTETTAVGHELQTCSCGWSKVTLPHGLRIYQGRMKYLKLVRLGPCINQYLLREGLSQLSEAQQQDTTHSALHINIPVVEDDNSSMTPENLEPIQRYSQM